jgi:RNA polymerase sigma factor for flagellar operon FliA
MARVKRIDGPLNDEQAALVASHVSLAAGLARRYDRPRVPLGFDDLLMAAVDGLSTAAFRFDPLRGVAFSTFGYPYARRAVLHAIRAEVRASQCLTGHQQSDIAQARRVAAEMGDEAPPALVAARMGVDEERARELMAGGSRRCSLDDVPEPSADGGMAGVETRMDLTRAMRRLPARRRRIVAALYFEEQPIGDVARSERSTRAAIRREAAAALMALRRFLEEEQPCGNTWA